jgi:hypothetical protein
MFALWILCWFGTAAAFRSKPYVGSVRSAVQEQQQLQQMNRQPAQYHQQQQQQQLIRESKDPAGDRDLVWSSDLSFCSDELLQALLAADPTITLCIQTDIQWDEAGTLTAVDLFTSRPFVGDGVTPVAFSVYSAYYNGQKCTSFDACAVTSTGVSFPGQYTYDCTNVYCGPNAARDCDGTYRDTQCTANQASTSEIPFLRNVNCEVYEDLVELAGFTETCGVCADSGDSELALTSITCQPQCDSCDSNGCLFLQESFYFSESFRVDIACFSKSEGGDDPFVCLTQTAPAQIDVYADESLFSCSVKLGDADCSCSICGFAEDADAEYAALGLYTSDDVLYQADCTNVDSVSTINLCDDTATGVFEPLLARGETTTCQGQQAAPVAQQKPPSAPPLTMLQPASAPISQPTTAAAPVSQPIAAIGGPVASGPQLVPPVNSAPVGSLAGPAPGVAPGVAPGAAPGVAGPPGPFPSSGTAYASIGTVVMAVGFLFLPTGLW